MIINFDLIKDELNHKQETTLNTLHSSRNSLQQSTQDINLNYSHSFKIQNPTPTKVDKITYFNKREHRGFDRFDQFRSQSMQDESRVKMNQIIKSGNHKKFANFKEFSQMIKLITQADEVSDPMRKASAQSKQYKVKPIDLKSNLLSLTKSIRSKRKDFKAQPNLLSDKNLPKIQTHSSLILSQVQKQKLFTRLHEDWKVRESKSKELEERFYQNQQRECITSREKFKTSSGLQQVYTKNYRGFYQRLDEMIAQNKKKYLLYDRLKLSSSGQKLFKPNQSFSFTQRYTTSSFQTPSSSQIRKRTVILSQKKSKCQKPACLKNQQLLTTKANETLKQFSLNVKSNEIIEKHEKRMFQSIKSLFYDKKNKRVKINAKKVSELSKKQFDILFDLITKVQLSAGKIKNQKMLDKQIKGFMHNLTNDKRLQLRRIQLLKSCRTGYRKGKTHHYEEINLSLKLNHLKESQYKQTSNSTLQRSKHTVSSFQKADVFKNNEDYCKRLFQFI